MVSPTGIVYDLGTPPRETRFSQTADLYLTQSGWERGLQHALEGISEDPGNALHYFQAGSAQLRLGRYAAADTLFSYAQRLYPAYELEVEPERESAWSVAFNSGVEAYSRGDVQAAIGAWTDAATIFDLRPEAHLNLGRLLVSEGRTGEAIAVYQDALTGLDRLPATRILDGDALHRRIETRLGMEETLTELLVAEERYAEAEPLARARMERDPSGVEGRLVMARILDLRGRSAEATELYASLLTRGELEAGHLLNLGVGLFHASRFHEASEAFRRLTEIQPESRDAWFNYANALFAGQAWSELMQVGGRLLELDPLGETAALITAKAHLESGDRRGAFEGIERAGALPVHLERLRFRRSDGEVTVEGRVQGNLAEAGTRIRLRFEFFDGSGSLGSEDVELVAPAPGASSELTVTFAAPAAWYRYAMESPGAG